MAEFLSNTWCTGRLSALRCRVNHDPKYRDCRIDERWADCQVFFKWLRENAVEGWVLDKDILVEGNRVYGPDTCVFVPEPLNLAFKSRYSRKDGGNLPKGVRREGPRFRAQITRYGKEYYLGTFPTVEIASLVAQRESLRHKYNVVMSYRNDPRLTALIDVLVERLKNQANTLRPKLAAANLL